MKKIIIITLLLTGALIWYLKYPLYSSWINDSYFNTSYSEINIHSKENWMIKFKKFEDWIIENKEDFKYLSKKYNCENWKVIKNINIKNIPNKCWNLKKYIESKDFLDMLSKKNKSLKKYDEEVNKKVFINYLNEKKVIENLKNKNYLVYTTEIKKHSDINFSKAKSSFIIKNFLNWNRKKAIEMLYNSIQNEIYILNNTHLDTVKFFNFETRLKIYISLLEKYIKNNKLSMYERKKFKLMLSKNKLEDNLMKKSLKTKYFEMVNKFDEKFKDNYKKNLKSNDMLSKAIFNTKTFLFVNFKETKELYKKYSKETLEQKKLSYKKPKLPLDVKNYIWKKIIWKYIIDYRYRFKQHEKLKEKIEKIKNKL